MTQHVAHRASDEAAQKQAALANIPGLTIGDVLKFFYVKATPRDVAIADLIETSNELEIDGAIISEGSDNGAFVLAWAWAPFDGTSLDKETKAEGDADA